MACVIVKCVIHLYDLMKGGGVIHWGGDKVNCNLTAHISYVLL